VAIGRMDAYYEEDIYMGCSRGLALVKAANGIIDIKSNKNNPNLVSAVATNSYLSIAGVI